MGQNSRSANLVLTDAVGPKADARRRISPRTCCAATIVAATMTSPACTESTCRLMFRVLGRPYLAHEFSSAIARVVRSQGYRVVVPAPFTWSRLS